MTPALIDTAAFRQGYDRFQALVSAKSGHPFRRFDEGMAAVWEDYKPRLREHALGLLRHDDWSEEEVASGVIVGRTIEAIEIDDNSITLRNNLVSWPNRYGHANRDHRVLLESKNNPKLLAEIERLLYGLYRDTADEGETFDQLSEVSGRKYPFLAYLFFLKDIDRFMPIHPTGFDRAFRALGVELTTLRQCSWTNYSSYNATLNALRPLIAETAGIKAVRLVDAHSFCWILSSLIQEESEGTLQRKPGDKDIGRVLGGREKSIIEMRLSVEETTRNANGQFVQRTMKNKNLNMSSPELQKLLESLLDVQENRCALSGIPFQFIGPDSDKNLHPSVDRIDSGGHYEPGNIQIVCRFINFWKGAADNEEFRRLLALVRTGGAELPT